MASAKKTASRKTSARTSPAKKTAKKTPAKKAPAKKTAAKKTTAKKASKRTLVEPHAGDKRYVRRSAGGQFNESDDVSKSLAQDVRKPAKTVSKPGQGDKGDAKKSTARKAGTTAKK